MFGEAQFLLLMLTLALLSKNIEIHEFPSVEFQISNDIIMEKVNIKNGNFLISDYLYILGLILMMKSKTSIIM